VGGTSSSLLLLGVWGSQAISYICLPSLALTNRIV
jgi:hypothetical protein